MLRSALLTFAILIGGLTSCSTMKLPPLTTVQHLDLHRYMGDWYVIANIPYSLENGKVGTLDRYTLLPDGKIQNTFLFRRGTLDAPLESWNAVAWVHNTQTNAEWRVRFFWPLRTPYLVIDLDKDYQWSVIGYPSRKLAWILCRNTSLNETTYQGIVQRMKKQGYDTQLLKKVPQRQ